jgi:AraC family transcriptional regulator
MLKQTYQLNFLSVIKYPLMDMLTATDTFEVTQAEPIIRTEYTSNTIVGRGFEIKKSVQPPASRPSRMSTRHTFQLNLGQPILLWQKSDVTWNSGICDSGDVAELTSPGRTADLKWNLDFHVLEISFDPWFIDKMAEKENVLFTPQFNFRDTFLKDIGIKFFYAFSDGFIANIYVESLAIACAIHLAGTYNISDKKPFAPKGKLSARQVKNVIDYVRCNVHASITLDELAACTYLSVFHFSRLFKNTIGVSPYQFVLQVKIDYAKKLIKDKNSIGDIAHSLGFTDSAHFCNTFKKLNGFSPLQYNSIV